MKYFGFVLFLALSFGFTHKYYISNTLMHYNEKAESLEISMKIFTDDFERALEEESGKTIKLGSEEENKETQTIIGQYLSKHFKISVNGSELELNYLGKEDEVDITRCYLEVTDVPAFQNIRISNSILFEQFEEQSNIIDIDYLELQKQIILTEENKIEVLEGL